MELRVHEPLDDRELTALAERARAGSSAAFDTLAARVRDLARGWAGRLTHDADDAEDVAQLVLLRLHTRVAQFEGRSRFTTWLYALTRSVVLSRRAKERRRDALLVARASELPGVVADGATDDADAGDIARLARACVGVLPRREREVFELSDLHGLNSPAIAKRLGIKPVTVRVMLVKARRKIRLRLLEQHPELLEEYGP